MRVRERLRQMLAAVEREGEMTVEDACKRVEASPATIRRDVQKRYQRGEVENVGRDPNGHPQFQSNVPLIRSTKFERLVTL